MKSSVQHKGAANYHAGLAAEANIERHYVRTGHAVVARRWRGRAGEIDLICQRGDAISFIEVKQARSMKRAAENLRPAQMHRLVKTAEEFLGSQPTGALTECQFDLGLVDQTGAYEIIENALMMH